MTTDAVEKGLLGLGHIAVGVADGLAEGVGGAAHLVGFQAGWARGQGELLDCFSKVCTGLAAAPPWGKSGSGAWR